MHTRTEDAHIASQEVHTAPPILSPPVKLDSTSSSPVPHPSCPVSSPVAIADHIAGPINMPNSVIVHTIFPIPITPASPNSDSDSGLFPVALNPRMSSSSAAPSSSHDAPSISQSSLTLDALLCWVDDCLTYFGIRQISASEQVSGIIYTIRVTRMRPWLRSNHARLCALSFDDFVMEIKRKWLKSDWKDDLVKRVKNDQPSGVDLLDWVTKLIEANESIGLEHPEFVDDRRFKSHVEARMSDKLRREYCYRDGEQKTLSGMDDTELWINTIREIEDHLSSERKRWISALVQHINENCPGPGPSRPVPPSLSAPPAAASPGPRLHSGEVWYNILPLTDEQRDLLRANRGCFKCHKFFAGHFRINCPATRPTQDAVMNCSADGLQRALQNRNSSSTPTASSSQILTTTIAAVLHEFSDDEDPVFYDECIPCATPLPQPPSPFSIPFPFPSPPPSHHIWWSCLIDAPFTCAPTDICALIDTGSPPVLISSDTVELYGLIPHSRHSPLKISGAFGAEEQVLDKYVRLHLLSPDRLWTSRVVNATIVPGLHADIILGLDFLQLNKIVIDVDENTAVCKDDGYDLLNPPSNPLAFKGSLPVFPPLCRKLERDAIRRAHADLRPSRIAVHNELKNFSLITRHGSSGALLRSLLSGLTSSVPLRLRSWSSLSLTV